MRFLHDYKLSLLRFTLIAGSFASLVVAPRTMAGGACMTAAECGDGLYCTIDNCFPPVGGGTCIYTTNTCSDSQFCNGSEICDEGRDACEVACLAGTICSASGFCECNGSCPGGNVGAMCDPAVQPVNCGPEEICSETLDSCVECLQSSHCTTAPRLRCDTTTGECAECLNDFDCQDGLFCNGAETCNPSTGLCDAGFPVQCDLVEFCSELLDRCAQCENDAHCSDGLYCNGSEVCRASDYTCRVACLGGGTCSAATGLCVGGSNAGEPCDPAVVPPNCRICIGGSNEGSNCTTTQQCPGGACRTYFCNETSDTCVECLDHPDCLDSDPNWCTRDVCIFNTCVHEHDNSRCFAAAPTGRDGLFCNGFERCEGGLSNLQCNNATGEGCCVWSCLGGGCSSAACPAGVPGPCYKCVGGQDNGKFCHPSIPVTTPQLSDGIACTVDVCNETADRVDHTPDHNVCGNNATCDGIETCDPDDENSDLQGCVEGDPVICSELATFCRGASCPENGCQTSAQNAGEVCDDSDPCTAITQCSSTARSCSNNPSVSCTSNSQCPARPFRCSNTDKICNSSLDCPGGAACGGPGTCLAGVCAEMPPSLHPGYRCVRLEWRNVSPPQAPIGGIMSADLYAVSDGCSLSTAACPTNHQWISDLTALLQWNPQQLQLLPPAESGQLNPEDPCDNVNQCFSCPAGQANWRSSGWEPDCSTDAINFPCGGQFPINDGDAKYIAVEPLSDSCSPVPPVCVPTSPSPGTGGLFVTRLKFKALRGGTAELHLAECAGERSTSGVSSKAPVPANLAGNNVLKPLPSGQLALPAQFVITCVSNGDCQDFNPCTAEQCDATGHCVFQAVPGSCDNGLFCDGPNDMCQGTVCTGGGNPCQSNQQRPFCNEVDDRCDECTGPQHCTDTVMLGSLSVPNVCTVDSCGSSGDCVHQPYDCDDGADCTTDTCTVVAVPPDVEPQCNNTPNDALCETGLFCNAQHCVPGQGCVPAHECVAGNGNPCADDGVCDEPSDTCGGCLMPALSTAGPRYLQVVPPAQGPTPIAFLVQGDCKDNNTGCVAKYVQSRCHLGPDDGIICASEADCRRECVGGAISGSPCEVTFDCGVGGTCVGTCRKGRLDDSPVFLTPQDWGSIFVTGSQIRPGSIYRVSTECAFQGGDVLSAAATVVTRAWGDTNGDGNANVIDVGTSVNAVKGLFGPATFEGANLAPCDPDKVVNVIDIGTVVDVLKGVPFSCQPPCP